MDKKTWGKIYYYLLKSNPIDHIRLLERPEGIWIAIDPYPHPDSQAIPLLEWLSDHA